MFDSQLHVLPSGQDSQALPQPECVEEKAVASQY